MSDARRKMILDRDALKHTLGNLTLLTPSANPGLGNLEFDQKREWLRQSLLKMNQTIANRPSWDEAAIQERAAALFSAALRLWPMP